MSDKTKKRCLYHNSLVKTFLMCLLLPLCLSINANGQEDAGQKVFETKCYSCHNIGGGDKQGPDLKGVTELRSKEWLEEYIKSPTAMSKKDADAAELFKKYSPEIMPDQTLSAGRTYLSY